RQPVPLRPAAQDLNAPSVPPAAPNPMGALPPMPAAPQPAVRRTLTGEIIQEPPSAAAPPPPQPGGYAGSAPAPGAPGLGVRPAPPNVVTMARRQERPAASRSSAGPIAGALAAIVLLGLVGFGGWWFVTHRGPSPKGQADKFLAASKALDFKGIYETADVDKTKYPTEQSYVQNAQEHIDKVPAPLKSLLTSLLSGSQFKTGEPTIQGDTATVPVTQTISFRGQSQTMTADLRLSKVDGIWKVSRDSQAMQALDKLTSIDFGSLPGAGGGGLPGGMGGGSGLPGGF
ncbi:MAG TPA: hypothetical protein VKT32_16295, partial [Chthonomonadaceae bacterium]|nr:hypothetical protein [Chthonomonadaceae bacterium]